MKLLQTLALASVGSVFTVAAFGDVLPPWQPGELEIHLPSFGVGEVQFYRFPDGTTWVNDCGDYPYNASVVPPLPSKERLGGEWTARYLKRLGVGARIDYLTITHWHDDHAGDIGKGFVLSRDGRKVCGAALLAEFFDFDIYSDCEWPLTNHYGTADVSLPLMRGYVDESVRSRGLKPVAFRVGALDQFGLRHDAKGAYAKDFHVRNLCANARVWTGCGADVRDYGAEHVAAGGDRRINPNKLSLAIRIDYGPFSYYAGGDVSGILKSKDGDVDYEAAVARACGPVTVAKVNHHGTPDAMSRATVAALRPSAWVANVWHPSEVNDIVMSRLVSRELCPSVGACFFTFIPELSREATKGCAWWPTVAPTGHIVIRVAPGGTSYRIYILENRDESMRVLATYAGVPGGEIKRVTRTFESRIAFKDLDLYSFNNLKIVKKPIRGIVIDHHGLGCNAFGPLKDFEKMTAEDAANGIVWIHPHYQPWAWMNDHAVRLTDRLVELVIEKYGLPKNLPICSSGGSMGGQGAYVYARYSRHNIRRVVVNCGVADLAYHYTERPDLPRTITAAFADAPDFEAELAARSPLALATRGEMPCVDYVIFHSDRDTGVNIDRHAKPMVAALKASGRTVEYYVSEGTGHTELKPELVKRYYEAIHETFASSE